jgi:hypothetical protein
MWNVSVTNDTVSLHIITNGIILNMLKDANIFIRDYCNNYV